jgi:methionyl-tRNA formyltransferase
MSIILFINGNLGLRVLNFVTDSPKCELTAVILNSDKKRAPGYLEEVSHILVKKNQNPLVVKWGQDFLNSNDSKLLFEHVNFGVSALFGHVLPSELIEKFSGGILNLHPSLLPIGRGADPVPWGIIERQKQGISIHLIDQNLDTGDIVFQKEIPSNNMMNAGEIYEIAMAELFNEFSRLFMNWVDGKIEPRPQARTSSSMHHSNELELLRVIKDDEISSFGSFIRRIRATSFSNGKMPRYIDDKGRIWNIAISISEVNNDELDWQ